MNRPNTSADLAFPLLLLGSAALLAAVDCCWAVLGHFDIAGRAYGPLAGLSALLAAAGYFYQSRRNEPHLAAMLFGAAFLIGFSSGASVLNTFLLTVAGSSIDGALADIDRLMGFDWPGLMARMADHPQINAGLKLIYNSVLPQIALAIVVLGWRKQSLSIYKLCCAIALGAMIVIFIWTLYPSFGAMAVYSLPADITARLDVALDGQYGQALAKMLADGPGFISPANMKGLVGFPSYHIVLALLVTWYLRGVPYLRWMILAANVLVVFATPIQGGHHWIDVIAGFPVAILVVIAADQVARHVARFSRARWLNGLVPDANEIL